MMGYAHLLLKIMCALTIMVNKPMSVAYVFADTLITSYLYKWTYMYVYVSIPFSRTLYLNDTIPFSFLWGSLADHFGRKPILIVSATLMAICSFILAFSVSYVMTVAFRVVLGFCSGKCHVCTELPSVTAVGNLICRFSFQS